MSRSISLPLRPEPSQTTVPVTPGHYAVGYQYVDTESGQETQATLLGKVGPVTFAVAQGGKASKKAA